VPSPTDRHVRWAIEVPGHQAHAFSVTPDRSSALIADGWGVAYRSLSLRRFDLGSGELRATVRLGDAARAFAYSPDGSQVLVASDKRLRRLDLDTLTVLEVWDRRVPRYAQALGWSSDKVVLKNAQSRVAHVFDLARGAQRRHTVGRGATLLPCPDGGFVALCSEEGSGAVWHFEDLAGPPRRIRETPAFISGAIDGEGSLWLALGQRTIESSERATADIEVRRAGPGQPASTLRHYAAGSASFDDRALPFRFGEIAAARSELWLTRIDPTDTQPDSDYGGFRGVPLAVERLRTPSLESIGTLVAPAGHRVAAAFPDAGVVFSSRPRYEDSRADVACLA
jgi:hypothetical protein